PAAVHLSIGSTKIPPRAKRSMTYARCSFRSLYVDETNARIMLSFMRGSTSISRLLLLRRKGGPARAGPFDANQSPNIFSRCRRRSPAFVASMIGRRDLLTNRYHESLQFVSLRSHRRGGWVRRQGH